MRAHATSLSSSPHGQCEIRASEEQQRFLLQAATLSMSSLPPPPPRATPATHPHRPVGLGPSADSPDERERLCCRPQKAARHTSCMYLAGVAAGSTLILSSGAAVQVRRSTIFSRKFFSLFTAAAGGGAAESRLSKCLSAAACSRLAAVSFASSDALASSCASLAFRWLDAACCSTAAAASSSASVGPFLPLAAPAGAGAGAVFRFEEADLAVAGALAGPPAAGVDAGSSALGLLPPQPMLPKCWRKSAEENSSDSYRYRYEYHATPAPQKTNGALTRRQGVIAHSHANAGKDRLTAGAGGGRAKLCNRRLDHRDRHDPCAILDACVGAVGRSRSVQLCKIIHAICLPRPPAPSALLRRRLREVRRFDASLARMVALNLQNGLSSTAQTLSVSLTPLAAVSAASSYFRFFWLRARGSAYTVGMPSTETAKPASRTSESSWRCRIRPRRNRRAIPT